MIISDKVSMLYKCAGETDDYTYFFFNKVDNNVNKFMTVFAIVAVNRYRRKNI